MHSEDLFTTLFNTTPASNNSREMLLDITKKYPYFSAAHFFLLQQTGKTTGGYEQVAAKTALHFGNPFLLNYRIKGGAFKIEVKVDKVERVDEVKKVDEVEKVNTIDMAEKEMEIKKDEEIQDAGKPAQKEEPLFEPLSATDYFASQGIKLSEEVQTGDKLGKQLKSFTEWLKTMKKVHDAKTPASNDAVDLTVQKLAEKSNEEDDIITESMAEAYLQQGKAKKAREILEKLSLFNPSKSAYFAAKIESIAADK